MGLYFLTQKTLNYILIIEKNAVNKDDIVRLRGIA